MANVKDSPDTLTVKLLPVWRVAWWCADCWGRGELLVPKGVELYTVQVLADNTHVWHFQHCRTMMVHVEWDTRRQYRLPKGRYIAKFGGIRER